MILTCPNCGTQYVVKDGAIPPQGRQVRCASCKHSWHQDPEGGAEQVEQDETIAEATLIDPRSGPEAEERAYEGAMLDSDQPETAPAQSQPSSDQAEDAAHLAAEQRAQEVSADFGAPEAIETPAPAATSASFALSAEAS